MTSYYFHNSLRPLLQKIPTDACSRVHNAEMVPHFLLVEEIVNIPGRKIAAGSLGAIALFYSYCRIFKAAPAILRGGGKSGCSWTIKITFSAHFCCITTEPISSLIFTVAE